MEALQSKVSVSHLDQYEGPRIIISVLVELNYLALDVLLHLGVLKVYLLAVLAISPCEEEEHSILKQHADIELLLL